MLVDGALTLYVERGGKTLLSWTDDPALLQSAADALALAVREGALGKLTVEKAHGASVLRPGHPLATALAGAGFHATPRGFVVVRETQCLGLWNLVRQRRREPRCPRADQSAGSPKR